jgi:hypothetical protein
MIGAGVLALIGILLLLGEVIESHQYYEHLRGRRSQMRI